MEEEVEINCGIVFKGNISNVEEILNIIQTHSKIIFIKKSFGKIFIKEEVENES